MYASYYCHPAVVEILLKHNAQVDMRNHVS